MFNPEDLQVQSAKKPLDLTDLELKRFADLIHFDKSRENSINSTRYHQARITLT